MFNLDDGTVLFPYLFKAVCLVDNKWLVGNLSIERAGHNVFINPTDTSGSHLVDSRTVCMFSGFKDDDGDMIWHGDIVRLLPPDIFEQGKHDDDLKIATDHTGSFLEDEEFLYEIRFTGSSFKAIRYIAGENYGFEIHLEDLCTRYNLKIINNVFDIKKKGLY